MTEHTSLTESHIAAKRRESKATGKRLELPDVGKGAMAGLSLVCNPSGVTSWVLRRRLPAGGNPLRFPIGSYSDLTLSKARDAAMVMRTRIDAGQKTVEVTQQANVPVSKTLMQVITMYEESPDVTRSWANARRTVLRIFQPLLNVPVASMRPKDLKLCANAYPKQPSAKLALRTIRPILFWGEELEYVPEGLALFRIGGKALKRDRVLDDAELARVLPVLHAMDRNHARAMLLMIWTASRRDEVSEATWDEFDLEEAIWTLPAIYTDEGTKTEVARTKNEKRHIIYLPHQAVTMLKAMNPTGKATGHVFLASRIRGKSTVSPVTNWDRFQKIVFAKTDTRGWQRHDLRRTAATIMGQLGSPPHVVEAALNHASLYSDLASNYNQHRYGDDVGDALQALADRLDAIMAGTAKPLGGRRMREFAKTA